MDEVRQARKRLKTVRERDDADYRQIAAQLDRKDDEIDKRCASLEEKRRALVDAHGNPDASPDDLIEINAGGKVVAAKRGTLCQLEGSRLEALFCGRWEKMLQRDGAGRIFLDCNPKDVRAAFDHVAELAISPPDSPPKVDGERKCITSFLIEDAFTNLPRHKQVDSTIIKNMAQISLLHEWLKGDESDGDFHLLYRSSRDGSSAASFHRRCDNKGCTLTIIKTNDDLVFGGYSSVSWKNSHPGKHVVDPKAFLFLLNEGDRSNASKLDFMNSPATVNHQRGAGPSFGSGNDHCLRVSGTKARFCSGIHTDIVTHAIKEIEVFSLRQTCYKTNCPIGVSIQESKCLSFNIKEAMHEKLLTLKETEKRLDRFDQNLNKEKEFVELFACGETQDIVNLNVCGTTMTTNRSTLQAMEECILARQFDNATWAKQSNTSQSVKDWTPEDVTSWVRKIDNVPEDVANIFAENKIAGNELLALGVDGLKMIGINRAATVCLLADEIKKLAKAGHTFIEHSPFCFGLILDHLRLKRLSSRGLVKEPPLPKAPESEKTRFVKIVKYLFPGDNSRAILGFQGDEARHIVQAMLQMKTMLEKLRRDFNGGNPGPKQQILNILRNNLNKREDVTFHTLLHTGIGRIVNLLTQHEDREISQAATPVLQKWQRIDKLTPAEVKARVKASMDAARNGIGQ